MNKLKFGIALFSLIFSITGFGQEVKDAKAQEILKGVSAKYKSLKSIAADFVITIEDLKDKTTNNQKGSILIKGDKYKLKLANQEIISDGKTVWTYLKDANEVQIDDVKLNDDAISPATIFTIYEKGFNSRFIEEKVENGKSIQKIELVPVDKKKKYFKVALNIDAKEKMLVSAKVFDKNGNHYNYSIEKFAHDVPAADDQFTFDKNKYPGVEVIDLR